METEKPLKEHDGVKGVRPTNQRKRMNKWRTTLVQRVLNVKKENLELSGRNLSNSRTDKIGDSVVDIKRSIFHIHHKEQAALAGRFQ